MGPDALPELLRVVALIGVLVAIAVPTTSVADLLRTVGPCDVATGRSEF